MAFTDAERVSIREFCGYPLYGGQPVQAFGYRFFQWYGTLEFRMTNLSSDEETNIRDTHLESLYRLKRAISGASENLDTDEAGPWKHNKNEVQDRINLYAFKRKELCNFFGVPPGPNFPQSGVRIVV